MTAIDFGQMRAADADRDVTAAALQVAYTEGRLNLEEYDERLGRALSARTYAELGVLTSDLRPAPRPAPLPLPPAFPQARRTNGLAIAALACGAAQPLTLMLSTLPAIVLGHVARSQIRRSGEDGAGMAAVGLALGWAGVAVPVLLFLLGMVLAVVHG